MQAGSFVSKVAVCLLLSFASVVARAAEPVESRHVLQFSAALHRASGVGTHGVTFALYEDEEGGSPLWTETQNVNVDADGRFNVVLGAVQTLPLEIFRSGVARWLSIQQIPEAERPRILLAAVPYALKAADADTLGGLPLSAFVLAEPGDGSKAEDGPLAAGRRDEVPQAQTTIARPMWTEQIRPGIPISNAAVTTGFRLASISGNTAIGFATTGGAWNVYLKPSSSATAFDSAELRLSMSNTELRMFGSVFGESAGYGVYGRSIGGSGNGVYGEATGTGATGVQGIASGPGLNYGGYFTGVPAGTDSYGVWATGGTAGVYGAATGTSGLLQGVFGNGGSTAGTNYGVYGTGQEFGVYGTNTSQLLAHGAVTGVSPNGTGLKGEGFYYGVYATASRFADAVGVYGSATSTSGTSTGGDFHGGNTASTTNYGVKASGGEWGVFGESLSTGGAAIGGRGFAGGPLIQMSGSAGLSEVRFRVTDAGAVFADLAYQTPAADLAERIDTADAVTPGDVVEIDPTGRSLFRLSRTARTRLVAGVVSTLPGVILNDQTLDGRPDEDVRPALALAGQVPVKVTTENGPIAPGDLLVASSTPGHAMGGGDNPSPGTVIGKALESFDGQQGTIKMLVLFR